MILKSTLKLGAWGIDAKSESVVKNWPWWLFQNSLNYFSHDDSFADMPPLASYDFVQKR